MTKRLFCCRGIVHSLQQEIDISLKLSRQPCRAISVASSSGGAMVGPEVVEFPFTIKVIDARTYHSRPF